MTTAFVLRGPWQNWSQMSWGVRSQEEPLLWYVRCGEKPQRRENGFACGRSTSEAQVPVGVVGRPGMAGSAVGVLGWRPLGGGELERVRGAEAPRCGFLAWPAPR